MPKKEEIEQLDSDQALSDESVKPVTEARAELEALIAVYKEQNPEKYEAKKAELDKKLNSL